MISIQNVKFSYRKHQEVLDGFSLDFPRSGIYGLLGKNGTGKSTLLYLMIGLLRPQEGSISIDGVSPALRRPENSVIGYQVNERYQAADRLCGNSFP